MESTRIEGANDQETMAYQQQQDDNDDQPTIPYQVDDDQQMVAYQQDDATLPHPVNAVPAVAQITYNFTKSQSGEDQLDDSVGYSFNTKWKNQRGDRHWQCVVRTKTLNCAAGMYKFIIIRYKTGELQAENGPFSHQYSLLMTTPAVKSLLERSIFTLPLLQPTTSHLSRSQDSECGWHI